MRTKNVILEFVIIPVYLKSFDNTVTLTEAPTSLESFNFENLTKS
jgi:hypothetical protein